MESRTASLSPEQGLVLGTELELLEQVKRSLNAARVARAVAQREARRHADPIESLRALREQAASAAEDDLPDLLHELSVRQSLLERPRADELPDPQSPYVAHLSVNEAGVTKHYCLGQRTHLDPAAGVRVVDWRSAPVARIFYGYREGDEYEEEYPGRVAEGRVVARRIVVIEHGELVQILSDDFVLTRSPDRLWQSRPRASHALAAGGGGSAVSGAFGASGPSITALLDAQQFAAISAPAERPLLILGSAGSGKTTVALHRLSRLTNLEPDRYPVQRALVLVPEPGLARLSRRLLAPLGVHESRVHTLDDWAIDEARRLFDVRLPRLCPETPALVSSLKRHPALYRALRVRFERKNPAKPSSLKQLRRRLAELLSDREFLSAVVHSARGTLSQAAIEATVRHTLQQLGDSVQQQLAAVVDRSRLRTLDARAIADDTPEAVAKTMDVEDLPILLALAGFRGMLERSPSSHLVLDEAEDFSLFELYVLGRQQGDSPRVTLAGDEAQQTSSSFAGFDAALEELGASEPELCRLAISYRCPRPIFEIAQAILGPLASTTPQSAAREGAPVGHFHFPNPTLANLFCANEVSDLLQREPRASIAVILPDAQAARRFHALLPESARARLVLAGEFEFEPGIDVTDVDNVKGLEFDYVILPDVSESAYPQTDEARRRLHVAVTRAVSQLWLVSGAVRSPILPELRS